MIQSKGSAMARMPHMPSGARFFGAVAISVILLFVMLSPAGSSHHGPQAMRGPVVRVRLLQAQDQVLLAATQPPTLRAASDGSPRTMQFPTDAPVQVVLAGDGWRVGGVATGRGELTVQPGADGSLTINNKAYRGRLRLVPVTADRFDVINDVDI